MPTFDPLPILPDVSAASDASHLPAYAMAAILAGGILALRALRIRRERASLPVEPALEEVPDEPEVPLEAGRMAFRREAWAMKDGAQAFLFAVESRDACIAHALVVPTDGSVPRFGRDGFLAGTIQADREALLLALNPGGVTLPVIESTSLVAGGLDGFARQVSDLAYMLRCRAGQWVPDRMMGRASAAASGNWSVGELGHISEHRTGDGMAEVCNRIPTLLPPPMPAAEPPELLDIASDEFATGHLNFDNQGPMLAFFRDWHAAVVGAAWPEGLRDYGRPAWTPEAVGFLSVTDDRIARRRQAVALQPAFLPTIAGTPSLVALVDGGRPFEAALLARVNRVAHDWTAPAIGMPQLRRLRTYGAVPPSVGRADIRTVLAAAAVVPVDRLPLDAEGWDAFMTAGYPTLRELAKAGLDMADLVQGLRAGWGPVDLLASSERGDPTLAGSKAANATVGFADMVRRLADTLVVPANPGLAPADYRDDRAQVTAARLLGAGRSARAVLALQAAWHARLPEFERVLPESHRAEAYAWPALFEPYRPFEGVEMHCLTTSADLRHEGWRGVDPDGRAGLAHCVGGYSRGCAMGESHIVSVRAIGADGDWTRLSTIEFRPEKEVFRIRQHRAAHNGKPSDVSVRAENMLVQGIASGSIPLDEGARSIREPMRAETAAPDLGVAFAAWRPYLTHQAAEAGVAGLLAAG